MSAFEWTLVDTETTGLSDPIYVVELAAQRMSEWEPIGPPFRVFINHDVDIPPAAQRIHGYSRDFLAKKGIDALSAHQHFNRYAGKTPIASYNLPYDYDKVLVPEWKRLRHVPAQSRGFCILKLTRNLVDAFSVSNFKLQTLREYFGLPDRGAHSASGDVMTVVDLLAVLHSKALRSNLRTLRDADNFMSARGYPDRLWFGKYRGRSYKEAASDIKFFGWLEWLSHQPESDSSAIGKWYLARLADEEVNLKGEPPSFGPREAQGASGETRQAQTDKQKKAGAWQGWAQTPEDNAREECASGELLARARREAVEAKAEILKSEIRRRREEAEVQRAASEAMLAKTLRASAEARARQRADQAMLAISPEAEHAMCATMSVSQKYDYLKRKYAAHKFDMARR